MIAIISDIHANLEALCAVLKDIEKHEVDKIICLGDIVGYGSDPEECIDMVMDKVDITLMGNHDYALIHGTKGFNSIAAEIIEITKDILKPDIDGKDEPADCFEPEFYMCSHEDQKPRCYIMKHSDDARWDFEKKLADLYKEGDILFVHGSPLTPVHEYIFPDKIVRGWNPYRLEEIFDGFENIVFCGHTHYPVIITSEMECIYPEKCDFHYKLDQKEKYIINSGSVGQPRDNDNRSCYILFDEKEKTVEWRRLTYDIENTMKKINDMCGKESWCSLRLMMGK